MDRCDVLIVGGGPAGSSCAAKLRAAGADVIVLDKKTFPREKPCAGWITPQVIETLQLDAEDYRRDRVFQPLTGFRTGLMSGREVETHYDRPVSFGIRRYEFDRYLLERSGAKCRLGETLKTLEREGDRWIINHEVEAAVVVGGGGHFCPIAQRPALGPAARPRSSPRKKSNSRRRSPIWLAVESMPKSPNCSSATI
jgi:flavin-dependent dehydrogenase